MRLPCAVFGSSGGFKGSNMKQLFKFLFPLLLLLNLSACGLDQIFGSGHYEGDINAPREITMMPYQGEVGDMGVDVDLDGTETKSSYYWYSTVSDVDLITVSSEISGSVSLEVYTTAAFDVLDSNWTWNCNTPDHTLFDHACTVDLAVPPGTILYIRARNSSALNGTGFTLNIAP